MTIIVPVIMSGGAGTRLWPLSTKTAPKQMHAISGGDTLLQETAKRVRADGFAAPIVVCAAPQIEAVHQQFSNAELPLAAVIAEPCPRNTAACAAVAALAVAQANGADAQVLLLSADHFVARPDAFQQAVKDAGPGASAGLLVTFGAMPTRPETGYGYILAGAEVDGALRRITRFVEKPDLPTAQAYVRDGGYLWNSGTFLFTPGVLLSELARQRPEIDHQARLAWEKAVTKDGTTVLEETEFAACPSEAVDTAVMEGTTQGAVRPMDVGWSDVGSWDSIHALAPQDGDHNAMQGPAVQVDCQGCLVMSDGPQVAIAGLENMAVIVQGGNVLVLPLDQAQKVKPLVAQLPDDAR